MQAHTLRYNLIARPSTRRAAREVPSTTYLMIGESSELSGFR
jgi:hypothetical protein